MSSLKAAILLYALAWLLYPQAIADPAPGEVFKEYRYGNKFSECDPGATNGFCPDKPKMVGYKLYIDDLADAVRAEVAVEFWGGHIGTSDQKFKVNNNAWILIPQPSGTPSTPNCYFRTVFGRRAATVPLSNLTTGDNVFQFTCGPQLCNSFNWGYYIIYSFTVRVYYDPAKKAHITGQITSPASGGIIGDLPIVTAGVSDPAQTVKVEFIGLYDDFDWDGNGVFREWQYQMNKTAMERTIGTAREAPYQATWDNVWVPDQTAPVKLAALVYKRRNYVYMTPAVSVTLKRTGRSVKMYRSSGIPKNFAVRTGATKSCNISVTDNVSSATAAKFTIHSWSATPEDGKSNYIKLNSYTVSTGYGILHDWSIDTWDLPLSQVKYGTNTFSIYSATSGHAMEVNWPGPVLKVQWGQTVGMEEKVPARKTVRWLGLPNPLTRAGLVQLLEEQPGLLVRDLLGRKTDFNLTAKNGLYIIRDTPNGCQTRVMVIE